MKKLSKQQVQYINRLKQKKFRKEYQQFIAEGNKVVSELLSSDLSIKKILVTKHWLQKYNNYQFNAIDVLICTNEEFKKISRQVQPEGIMAICQIPESKSVDLETNEWIIALDQINDPGNLGTIIRIADWWGISTLLCDTKTVDAYNPKVVQSTMGSIGRLSIIYCDLASTLNSYSGILYSADLEGASIYELEHVKPGIILIGNESHGIDQDMLTEQTKRITIPRLGEAESLNAAVACGIIVSHLVKNG